MDTEKAGGDMEYLNWREAQLLHSLGAAIEFKWHGWAWLQVQDGNLPMGWWKKGTDTGWCLYRLVKEQQQ